ncbi:MAG: hypothetical protein MZU97_26440 [Bacillus subtilis]|nr:hypothetical protein [Bacillus subtilis]
MRSCRTRPSTSPRIRSFEALRSARPLRHEPVTARRPSRRHPHGCRLRLRSQGYSKRRSTSTSCSAPKRSCTSKVGNRNLDREGSRAAPHRSAHADVCYAFRLSSTSHFFDASETGERIHGIINNHSPARIRRLKRWYDYNKQSIPLYFVLVGAFFFTAFLDFEIQGTGIILGIAHRGDSEVFEYADETTFRRFTCSRCI